MEGLKREELVSLILAVRAGDSSAFDAIVAAYRPLLQSLSNLYPSPDEYYSEACIALYKAVKSYNVGQDGVTFGLYATIVIRRHLRSYHNKNESEKSHISDEDVEAIAVGDGIINRLFREEEYEEFCRRMQEILSDLEYRVLWLWLEGLKTADIARVLSIDAKSVDNAKARIQKKIRGGIITRK